MKFTIHREDLIKPLALVSGVIERKHTMQVLSNILLLVQDGVLYLTGSDSEIELIAQVRPDHVEQEGSITVPARKLFEICKSLPDQSSITFQVENHRATFQAGKARFTLTTLPASDFPKMEVDNHSVDFSLPQASLRHLIDRTGFAMAQQDVRYYLNGMLLEIEQQTLRAVATDGHRLAMCKVSADTQQSEPCRAIVPRKGILELARLLVEGDLPISLQLGTDYIRASTAGLVFTSRLVSGKFPEYQRVIPRGGDKTVTGDRQQLRNAFSRAAILSNEKIKGIRLSLQEDSVKIIASNPEQEQAEDEVAVNFTGQAMDISFNVVYLLDVLSALQGDMIKITVADPNSSALLEDPEDSNVLYVIMPMHL